jgi:uncharacterized protein (TIGR02246 family)
MLKDLWRVRTTFVALVAVLGYGAVQLLIAQPAPAAGKDDEQALRKAADELGEAFNKGDAEAVVGFWTPDAEYFDTTGKATRGRAALTALFRKGFEAHKGTKTKFQVNSLRFLKPDVALEDGTMSVTRPQGTVDQGRYAAIWVKTDGKWLLSSVRDLADAPVAGKASAHAHLKQLEWLVGEWSDSEKTVDVQFSCRWDANHSFLLQHFTVKLGDAEPFTVTQRLGWDPLAGQIRSWTFDSRGGFAEGSWTRDGNQWVVETAGVTPDGRVGTGKNVWKYVDDKTFIWQAKDRHVDGDPLADVEVKLVRKAAKP